jgi:hypothetical protein
MDAEVDAAASEVTGADPESPVVVVGDGLVVVGSLDEQPAMAAEATTDAKKTLQTKRADAEEERIPSL